MIIPWWKLSMRLELCIEIWQLATRFKCNKMDVDTFQAECDASVEAYVHDLLGDLTKG